MKHLLVPLHIIIDRILSVVLRKGPSQLVRLVRVVQLVELSGEIAYHYSYLQYGRVVRKGVFQLVRLVQVVQVVKLHIITLTYSSVEL